MLIYIGKPAYEIIALIVVLSNKDTSKSAQGCRLTRAFSNWLNSSVWVFKRGF